MNLVIDASVVIKWFVSENFSEEAEQILSGEHQLSAPDFLMIEISNIIWKKVRIGDILPETGEEIVLTLQSGVLDLLPTIPLLSRAQKLSYRLDHPVYDCLYLACSLKYQSVLITADRKFFKRVRESEWSDSIEWVTNSTGM